MQDKLTAAGFGHGEIIKKIEALIALYGPDAQKILDVLLPLFPGGNAAKILGLIQLIINILGSVPPVPSA